MSRTYKDMPAWVRFKRNAYNDETKNSIYPNFLNKIDIELLPQKTYYIPTNSHNLSYEDMQVHSVYNALDRINTTIINQDKIYCENTFKSVLSKQKKDNPPLDLKKIVADFYNVSFKSQLKTEHDFPFIPEKINPNDHLMFIVEDNILLIAEYKRVYNLINNYDHYKNIDHTEIPKKDTGSMMVLTLKIMILHDLQEDNTIPLFFRQNVDRTKFKAKTIIKTNKSKRKSPTYKNKNIDYPYAGNEKKLQKTLKDYKKLFNSQVSPVKLEDKI